MRTRTEGGRSSAAARLAKGRAPLALVGCAALVVAGLAGWRATRASEAPAAAAVSAKDAAPDAPVLRLAWPKGTRQVYGVRWTAATHASTPGVNGGRVDGDARFAGELALSALGQLDGRALVSVKIANVTEHALRVMGAEAIPDDDAARATFDGREAWATFEPSGRVASLYFKKEDPTTFTQLVQSLLGEMEVDLGDGVRASWTSNESDTIGTGAVAYEVTETQPATIARTRARYATLLAVPGGCPDCVQAPKGQATIVLDPAGFVRSIDATESIEAARGTEPVLSARKELALKWLRTETFPAPTDVTLDASAVYARRPGQVVASRRAEDAALADRVGNMTPALATIGVDAYERTGKLMTGDFVWRASGLVIQHPEVCDALVAKFTSPGTKSAGHALVLDVLASAGTERAQAAMREALSSPAAKGDRAYPMLLQRFSVVPAPQPETLRFVANVMSTAQARGDGDAKSAAAYALGSLARAASAKDPVLASTYAGALHRGLADAKTASDKATYLHALGNAGGGDAKALEAYATDGDPAVRAALAAALRRDGSRDARDELDALVADADPDVQREALSSLDQGPVAPEDMRAVATEVSAGAVAPKNEGNMVTFLAKHASDDPASVKQMLGYLLQQADARSDRTASVRIRTLLQQMP